MALVLRVVSHSEIGLVRKNNQDSGYASAHLIVVADGMGGAAAGDLASAVAVDTLMRVDDHVSGEAMLATMADAVATANDRLADLVADDVALDGMGTTVTAALFDGHELGLVHIGDSRAYVLRDGRLQRLTHDHSWVQSLVDEGKISEEEAAVHPHRSLLLRVLNGQTSSEPELSRVEVADGDRLMFCSDGLCGLVDDDHIAELMGSPDRADALGGLVDAARAAGGIDNITVIVADVAEAAAGLTGTADDTADTPAEPDQPAVIGAAAERHIPEVAEATVRVEAAHDTTINPRVRVEPVGAEAADATFAEDEARYDPRPPARRRLLRPVLIALLAVLVVGAGLGTGYAWTRTQYYVGTAGTEVAIYQGLSEGLPGIPLSTLYEVQQQLPVASLPPFYQDRVRAGIDVSSLASARETVTELRDAVAQCEATPTASPSPAPTPRASTTARATPSPSTGSPSAGASPSTSLPPASVAPTSSTGTGC